MNRECGSDVGLCVEYCRWYHAGATTADSIAAGKALAVPARVVDYARMPPDQVQDRLRLMPGEGVIDLVGFFQAFQKIGSEVGVAVRPHERHFSPGGGDPGT